MTASGNRKPAPGFKRRTQKQCRFTKEGITHIDYKDIDLLKDYITETGKIVSSRVTGTRANYQRQLAVAIKRARYVALLPYTDRHGKFPYFKDIDGYLPATCIRQGCFYACPFSQFTSKYMKNIVAFITANYFRTVLAIVIFGFLSAVIPLFALVSGALSVLVTLRFGYRRGISVAVGAFIAAAIAVFAATLIGWQIGYMPLFWILFTQWLPPILFAEIFRRMSSLTWCMYALTLTGIVLLFAVIVFIPDIDNYWAGVYAEVTSVLEDTNQLPAGEELNSFFSILTGVVIASFLMLWSLMLLLGRWWQSLLDSPGSFGYEFTHILIGKKYSLGSIALLSVWLATESPMVMQLCVVMMIPVLVLQGVASWHFLLGQWKSRIGHILFYVSLALFVVVPQLLLVLILTGIIESFAQVRKRLSEV